MQTIQCPQCLKAYPTGTASCPVDGALLSASKNQTIIPGLKIGEYVIEAKIGEGGMGEVWSGKHPQIGKMVAIKILSQNMSNNPDAVARFVQEARAVNEIQHRNIVDIFSFGELADGRPYFVMEQLRGKSLAGYLQQKKTLPFVEILSIFEQICSALHACHARNIVHRDLKPDNIFLSFGGGTSRDQSSIFVKLLDFGIAKLDSTKGENLTGSGVIMGTPAYMSPEQCEGAKKVEPSSDIYALGIILFELLTGRTPFREPDDGLGAIISKQMFQQAPLPSALVAGRSIPVELDLLVLRTLSKNPAERPVDCLQLYDEMVKAIGEQAKETSEAIQSAKPIYEGAGIPESVKKIATQELAKKQTQNTSSTAETRMAEPTLRRTMTRPSVLGGLVVCVLLGSGLAYLSSASAPENGATRVSLAGKNLLNQPALLEPATEKATPTSAASPSSEPSSAPVVVVEEDPTPTKKTPSKKTPKKTPKKKDSLLLKDDD